MSKRSRRRARQARERALAPQRLLSEIYRMFVGGIAVMAETIRVCGGEMEKVAVLVEASSNEWTGAVSDALQRNDSLPLLVYADWLEERNEHRKAATVRRLAERMKEQAEGEVPSGPAPGAAVSVNGVPVTITEWEMS